LEPPQSCSSLAPRAFEGAQFGFSVLLLEMAVAADGNQLSLIEKIFVSQRITERSLPVRSIMSCAVSAL
jgi:hypothetical protein